MFVFMKMHYGSSEEDGLERGGSGTGRLPVVIKVRHEDLRQDTGSIADGTNGQVEVI